ncbi:hypothetical protein DK26_05000 [Bosea sp. WAO]|uniref:hypothetical protein n=1 Tax=Bosea sp. WAO TaxID=406341 RepID=UPI000746CED8|nr:hypothetical protein [Bosea sp. WAO]KUL96232.1 hypothetical protein DK26_05000 [Bosea sp. WAO]
MTSPLKSLLTGCGALAVAALWSAAASAQYYSDDHRRPGYERRGYDRGYDGGYDRRDERRNEYRNDRAYDRGYERGSQRSQRDTGFGPGPAAGRGKPPNAVDMMTVDEQKRALKNYREAQKKAIKRGYVLP